MWTSQCLRVLKKKKKFINTSLIFIFLYFALGSVTIVYKIVLAGGVSFLYIINDVSNCSAYCYLNISTNQVSDESCGDETGSIDITVLDATSPYIVSWDNGSTTDDISSLSAGTYTVTVLDANQCELIASFTVGNNAGTLEVSSNATSNENCGNNDGTIDIVTAGGTSPYSYVWSNGATTEDVTGLFAGTYDVIINDNAGCTITEVFTVKHIHFCIFIAMISINEYQIKNLSTANCS